MQYVYNLIITDNQDFWEMPTDFIATASNLANAKELLRDWLLFNYDYDELLDLFGNEEISITILKTPVNIAETTENDVETKRFNYKLQEILNF